MKAALRNWLGVPSTEQFVAQVRGTATGELAAASDDPENPASWLSLDYVHDRVLDQLEAQNERWETADARLRLILGLIGVVFAVTIGLVPKVLGPTATSSDQTYLSFWVGAPTIAATAIFLIAGLIAVIAWWPLTFNRPPKPDDLRNEYLTTDTRVTRYETAASHCPSARVDRRASRVALARAPTVSVGEGVDVERFSLSIRYTYRQWSISVTSTAYT